ncbi:MAG: hypothetical protein K9M99_01750 [Candidatus Cloacimonetes bacterium]|nr:hypothetical protein [Candidatus Cloacimonadota bacterium]
MQTENKMYDVYHQVSSELQKEAIGLMGNNAVSHEIVYRILLAQVKTGISSEYSVQVEADKFIKELQSYCYNFALKLTSEPELASDIAQDSIIELFKNIDKVEFIKGWLKSTVYNKTMTAIKEKINFRTLLSELEQVQSQYPDLSDLDESKLIKTIPEDQVKELLSEADYLMFKDIKKYSNLKEYSEAAGISYGTARKHSHIIRRNLKAAYLRQHGWQAKPEILTYKQYDNLRRFVHRLLDFSRNNEVRRLKRYCSKINFEEVQNCLSQITQISDWGVRYLGEYKYELVIWDKNNWQITILMIICVPPDKAISILSSKTLKCMGKMENKYNKKIPLHKGLITLKLDELVEYLSKP